MDTNNLQQSTLFDESGVPVAYARECISFPEKVLFPITQKEDLDRINNLISQSIQGVINTQSRTVELVFQPEIHDGLKKGTFKMMQTGTGETLADVIHVSGEKAGKIAGKGRIIESGKLKQLATGSFQIASLIVAQAHLADINKNLTEIKTEIESLHEKIDIQNLSKINGRINYLKEIIKKMHRGEFDYDISLQIRNKIEDTVADAYEWQEMLFSDLKTLISTVGNLKGSDTFGTGDTYKKLKKTTENIHPLINRRNVLLKISSLLAYIQSCIDPMGKEFSQFDLMENDWSLALQNLTEVITNKTESLLSKAKFNSEELLEHRRFFILKTLESANSLATHNYEQFENSLIKLKNNHRKVLSETGKLRLAITHDDKGNVERAAIVD
ncbi:hypothetical protein [Pantoea cypripedii]|uniref:Uncharacterized protein n=1 Tax=Pantoea cypripedii TaxID=55209 RepID=A0A6B9GB64_PANCY|nr:hypothetical protein [Pantoea cypripedii]QGY32560.1 hypothetical protein CUN67_26750 [Pantoea cypripedii]